MTRGRNPRRQNGMLAIDLEACVNGGNAVAEAAVDSALGGSQHGEGFFSRSNLVEVVAHDVGEDPPAAMGGKHGNSRQTAGLDGAPRRRQFERVGATGPDELFTIQGDDRPVEFERLLQRFELLILLIEVEGALPDPGKGAQLIWANGTDGMGHDTRLGNGENAVTANIAYSR